MNSAVLIGKPVPDVSYSLGGYYTLHIVSNEVFITSSSKHAKNRRLSLFYSPDGYLKAKLNNYGVLLHSIMAELYLGKRPDGLVINHKDCNKVNNHPDNLEYVTIAENIKHSIKHGMHVASDPARMPTYKDGRTLGRLKEYKSDWYYTQKLKLSGGEKEEYLKRKTPILDPQSGRRGSV